MAADAAILSTRLAQRPGLVATGVFDALSAVLAERAGFEALFLSGSALALTQLARPDVGLLTLTELADSVARISQRVQVPLLVDADHGFGNAINVSRAVQVLERAGASGIQLEDRVEAALPADLGRRPVVGTEIMLGKLRAALDARRSPTTIISARTDAFYSAGLDDALERAERFIETGADMVFVEGCVSDQDRRRVVAQLSARAPVLFNTSILPPEQLPPCAELAALGYAVILFPAVAVAAAGAAMQESLAGLQAWTKGAGFAPAAFDAGASIGSGPFMKKFTG